MNNITAQKNISVQNQYNTPSKKDASMSSYKLSIYNKIDEWSSHADHGDFVWISISDECFAAMKQNPSYESWVLNKIYNFYSSCSGDHMDTFAVLQFGPLESDYKETLHTMPDRKMREYLRKQEQDAKKELRKKRLKQYEKKILEKKWTKQEIERIYVQLKIIDHRIQVQNENKALRFGEEFYPADHSASLYAAAKRRASAYESTFIYHDDFATHP